jgi:Ca2+-binding RTX toxin-like protein
MLSAAGDMAIEGPDGSGFDTVQSPFDYSLGGAIEHLVLTGSAANGTGNANANRISGNALANQLLGLTGNDTLMGGAGNDTLNGAGGLDNLQGGGGDDLYILNLANDLVTELPGAGTDTVRIAVNYALPGNVEKLVFTGGGSVNGTGNALANEITGNSGNNRLAGNGGNDMLAGGDGNDTLNGGAGVDSLTGDSGNDRFTFTRGQGHQDTVTDFDGNDALAGDELFFVGYRNGTFVQLDATHWRINFTGGSETLTFANAPAIDVTDYTFA